MMIDAHLFAKIETYKTMVEDQARNPELEYFARRHLVRISFSISLFIINNITIIIYSFIHFCFSLLSFVFFLTLPSHSPP